VRRTYRPETPEGAAHSSDVRFLFGLTCEHDGPISDHTPTHLAALMTIHKKILEWQAAHPNTTWIGWGVVWLIVLAILF
jgi:hypothetical protein